MMPRKMSQSTNTELDCSGVSMERSSTPVPKLVAVERFTLLLLKTLNSLIE
jgi:hypothetical protein